MEKSPFVIRHAHEEDMEAVHQLVIELAIYENEPDAVLASVDDFKESWKEGLLQCTVAEIVGEVVGMACYYLTFSTWKGKMMYLEDFVISEEHRRKGIGQALFEAVIDESKKQRCRLIKWQVLHWNDPAINFYKKNQSIIEKEWWNGKIVFHEKDHNT